MYTTLHLSSIHRLRLFVFSVLSFILFQPFLAATLQASLAPEAIPVRQLSEAESQSFWQETQAAYTQSNYALVFSIQQSQGTERYPAEEGWLYRFRNADGQSCWRLYFPATGYQYWLKDTLEAWGYQGNKVFQLDTASLFSPLSPHNAYSLYDLSLLYMHTPVAQYIASKRFLGRKAHTFRLNIPAAPQQLRALEVCLDAHLLSLLKLEWLNPDDASPLRTLKVLSFQKNQEGVWFAKRLQLLDHQQPSKTELTILACTFCPSLEGVHCQKPSDLTLAPPYPCPQALIQP